MTTWTRPDGKVVEVGPDCTTRDQLMAYLDEEQREIEKQLKQRQENANS